MYVFLSEYIIGYYPSGYFNLYNRALYMLENRYDYITHPERDKEHLYEIQWVVNYVGPYEYWGD